MKILNLSVLYTPFLDMTRLENEHLNNVGKFRAFKSVPLPFNYDEDEDRSDQAAANISEIDKKSLVFFFYSKERKFKPNFLSKRLHAPNALVQQLLFCSKFKHIAYKLYD